METKLLYWQWHMRDATQLIGNRAYNNRMQSDFGELALPSAADAKRYVAETSNSTLSINK